MYKLSFTNQASEDLAKLKRNEPASFKKAGILLEELLDHPKIGSGKPKPLKGNYSGYWSRRITDKHRLIYEIKEDEVIVVILSAYGHYDDK